MGLPSKSSNWVASSFKHRAPVVAKSRRYGWGRSRRQDDTAPLPVRALIDEVAPDVVFVPEAVGNHVDRVRVTRAFLASGWAGPVRFIETHRPFSVTSTRSRPSLSV